MNNLSVKTKIVATKSIAEAAKVKTLINVAQTFWWVVLPVYPIGSGAIDWILWGFTVLGVTDVWLSVLDWVFDIGKVQSVEVDLTEKINSNVNISVEAGKQDKWQWAKKLSVEANLANSRNGKTVTGDAYDNYASIWNAYCDSKKFKSS